MKLTVNGINELNASIDRETGYRVVAEQVAAYAAFIRDGKACEVGGQKVVAKGSAKFGARELFAASSHPSGGDKRRSYTLAVFEAAGFVTVSAKNGAKVPQKDGNASIVRFLAPRAFAYWKAQGYLAADAS